jgi:ribose-phosphate pyrophosphokinase
MTKAFLFTGTAHPALARRVAAGAGIAWGDAQVGRFADGEIHVQVKSDVRDALVFVLQPTSSSEAILELALLADALKRDQPLRLVLLLPYFGYGRQERRTGRGPVSAEVMARLLNQSGADALFTVELHAPVISSFFTVPHHSLYTSNLFADCLRRELPASERIVIVSPDRGGVARAEQLNGILGAGRDIVVLEKDRLLPDECQIRSADAQIDLTGQCAVLIDDIVSTGSTLVQAAEWLVEHGAASVWACATHLVASPGLFQRLAASPIERLLVTDSLPCPEASLSPKVHVLSLAPLLVSALGSFVEQHVLRQPLTPRLPNLLFQKLAQALTHGLTAGH